MESKAIFDLDTALLVSFELDTAPFAISLFFTSPFLMSCDNIDSSMMSDDPTVFAAYALSSGDAIKAPAIKAARISPPIFRLIMLSARSDGYKTGYGKSRRMFIPLPKVLAPL